MDFKEIEVLLVLYSLHSAESAEILKKEHELQNKQIKPKILCKLFSVGVTLSNV